MGLPSLLERAREQFSTLERQQEDMLRQLTNLRVFLCGSVNSIAVTCPQGHPLLPLGTHARPTGSAEYRHWACNGPSKLQECTQGIRGQAASHLSGFRRLHCGRCQYDLCEGCYRIQLHQRLAEKRVLQLVK